MSVIVLRGDKEILRHGFGNARPDAIQPLFSTSKQFTAVAILKLTEEGRLRIDDPVGQHLPRWFQDEPALRVQHLLRHQSGLAEFTGTKQARAFDARSPTDTRLGPVLDTIDAQPRRFSPGRRHAYANSNYTVLAALVEQLSRAELGRHITAIGAPLGIASCSDLEDARIATGYGETGKPVSLPLNRRLTYVGNDGLCGSADALALWTRRLHEGAILSPPMLRRMRSAPGGNPPYGFGLSLLPIAGQPAWWHAGVDQGWTSLAAYLPREQITVVVLANRGWLWLSEIAAPIVRTVLGLPAPMPQRLRLSRLERSSLDGAFEDGLFTYRLTSGPNELILHNPAFGPPIRLWKQASGRFLSPDRPDTFRLELHGARIRFDWAEHRATLVRLASAAAPD
jgi:CubicO group peptidase (beta-lactamase class C family)